MLFIINDKMGYFYALSVTILFLGVGLSNADDFIHSQSQQRIKRSTAPCHDRYAVIPHHTMCLSKRKEHPITKTIQDAIVKKHNDLRSAVTPTASNMLKMSYSDVLEEESQIWAEQCKMTHDHMRYLPGLYNVGQNIASSGVKITWDAVIQLWYDEYKNFTYGDKNFNFHDIGHYTQVVWATTAQVGCGMTKCGKTYYYVCNYGPAGNTYGQIETPYIKGTSAANCSGHSDGTLCDCGSKVCLNGGVLNLTTCKCQCNKDVKRYDPETCELYCEKGGDNPLCGITPFDKKHCWTNSLTPLNCPWLCNVCPYAGSNYTDGDVPLPSSSAQGPQWSVLYMYIAIVLYVVFSKH